MTGPQPGGPPAFTLLPAQAATQASGGLTDGQRNGADTCVRYLAGKLEFLR